MLSTYTLYRHLGRIVLHSSNNMHKLSEEYKIKILISQRHFRIGDR